jgi:LysM repeat protein
MTTSWYTLTIDHDFSPPVITHTLDEESESLYNEKTAFCWISDEVMLSEDFISWNMEEDCLTLFESYCQPDAEDPIPTSTAIPESCTPTFTTDTPTTTTTQTTVPTPTPTQPGMISGCNKFHQVEDGDQCDAITAEYEISLDEFYTWNPDVGTGCGSLWIDYYVCVGVSGSSSTSTTTGTTTTATTTSTSTGAATPTPTQPNMMDGCTEFHQVASGDQCGAIASEHGISLDDLYTWNPDIGTDCKALWLDYYVCVGRGSTPTSTSRTTTRSTTTTTSGVATPTPTQPNMIATCRKFHLVQSGDQCGTIASENNITLADFYSWNPDVGSSCGSLWLDYYVCVGVA